MCLSLIDFPSMDAKVKGKPRPRAFWDDGDANNDDEDDDVDDTDGDGVNDADVLSTDHLVGR